MRLVALVAMSMVGLACGASQPAVTAPRSSPPPTVAPGRTAPAAAPPSSATASASSEPPKGLHCGLDAPVASDDACATDADCAPSAACHAPACVAKSKAQPRKPGEMCTQMLACNTADANACACWQGKCALVPKK